MHVVAQPRIEPVAARNERELGDLAGVLGRRGAPAIVVRRHAAVERHDGVAEVVVDCEGTREARMSPVHLEDETPGTAGRERAHLTVLVFARDGDPGERVLAPAVAILAREEILRHDVLERLQISADRPVDRRIDFDLAVMEEDAAAAERLYDRHVVADEEDGPALARDPAHLPETLLLECEVPDGEHLVDEQDLRLQMRGDREREPDLHTARVALDRRVEEVVDLGKRDDLVEAALDLPLPHPEDRAVEVDVLAPRQLGVKADSDLEQRAHATANVCEAVGRLRDPREDLQQRRLACAVAADDPDDLAGLDLERDVAERPDPRVLLLARVPPPRGRERAHP